MGVYRVNDKIYGLAPHKRIYYGLYLYNIVSNVLKFRNNDIKDSEIKDFIKETDLIPLGVAP